MELAAKKNLLTADEAKGLFTLYQCGEAESMRRLSELSDLPLPRLFLALQKLERKKLVEISDEKGTKKANRSRTEDRKEARKEDRKEDRKEKNRILLRPEAKQVCEEFRLMQEELKEICFAGFTEEERKAGEELLHRLNENMIRFMAKEA